MSWMITIKVQNIQISIGVCIIKPSKFYADLSYKKNAS